MIPHFWPPLPAIFAAEFASMASLAVRIQLGRRRVASKAVLRMLCSPVPDREQRALEGSSLMSESTEMKPTARVLPHELPASLREAGLTNGLGEKVIMACLLHDIAIAGLLSANHGYWGAQLVAPYVDEEVSWPSRNTKRCATSRTSRLDTPTRRPTSTISGPTTPRPITSAGNMGPRAGTAGK